MPRLTLYCSECLRPESSSISHSHHLSNPTSYNSQADLAHSTLVRDYLLQAHLPVHRPRHQVQNEVQRTPFEPRPP